MIHQAVQQHIVVETDKTAKSWFRVFYFYLLYIPLEFVFYGKLDVVVVHHDFDAEFLSRLEDIGREILHLGNCRGFIFLVFTLLSANF